MSLSHQSKNSYYRPVDAIDRALDCLADRAVRKGYLRPCGSGGGWLVDELGDGMRSLTRVNTREAGLLLLCADQGGTL